MYISDLQLARSYVATPILCQLHGLFGKVINFFISLYETMEVSQKTFRKSDEKNGSRNFVASLLCTYWEYI